VPTENVTYASAVLNGTNAGAYLYNAFEQRVQKTVGAAVTQFVVDRFGHLLAEANGSGAAQKEYLWLDDLPVAVVDAGGASPVLYFIHSDQLGTPQKITNASAVVIWDGVFDPFGNPAYGPGGIWNTSTWNNFAWGADLSLTNLRFPGQYADAETALNQNWFRDYDPTIGRYVQSDPVGLEAGINTYIYADVNPVKYIDPDGRFIPVLVGIAAGYLFDYAVSKWKKAHCNCENENATPLVAAAGGAEGLFGPFAGKPRAGVSGGGPSGPATSVYSQAVGSAYESGAIGLPTRNVLRGAGRAASRVVPVVGAGLAAYELYDAITCQE
jgi:RHS repeat-associated protein